MSNGASPAAESPRSADGALDLALSYQALQLKYLLFYAALLCLLIVVFLLYLGNGPLPIAASKVITSLLPSSAWPSDWQANSGEAAVIQSIRLPRALMALTVGAGLAVSGAAMQGLFRNPLADPGLLGVSGGAALAAVCWIVFGASIVQSLPILQHQYSLPLFAFVGSALASLSVFYIADRQGASVAILLLTGIAINAISGALTGLMVYAADDEQLRSFTFWTMGSLANGSWENLRLTAPVILCTTIVCPFFAKGLNALLLGEAEAQHIGFSPKKLKVHIILLVSLSVGAAVAFCGMIGFVGLVVPHLIRLVIGPDHQRLLPASALLGGSLLLLADLLARSLVSPAELPIGLLTASLGGPFFLWLISRQANRSLT